VRVYQARQDVPAGDVQNLPWLTELRLQVLSLAESSDTTIADREIFPDRFGWLFGQREQHPATDEQIHAGPPI
jgi:hypothetical protein